MCCLQLLHTTAAGSRWQGGATAQSPQVGHGGSAQVRTGQAWQVRPGPPAVRPLSLTSTYRHRCGPGPQGWRTCADMVKVRTVTNLVTAELQVPNAKGPPADVRNKNIATLTICSCNISPIISTYTSRRPLTTITIMQLTIF